MNGLGEDEERGRKYVHHTVAHIHHQEQSYCITGQGVPAVLRMVLGYLLANTVLGFRLQFFVDGQKTRQAAILHAFSWFKNVGIIWDWYHLEDTCKRQVRLAMKGKDQRNAVLEKVATCLWDGRGRSAIAYLQSVPEETIKNPDALQVLMGYFERTRPSIPCYDVRTR